MIVLSKTISDESRARTDRLVLDELLSSVDRVTKEFFLNHREGEGIKLHILMRTEGPGLVEDHSK